MTVRGRYEDGLRHGDHRGESDLANWVGCGGIELEYRQVANYARLHYASRAETAFLYGVVRGYRERVRDPFPKRDSLETATEGGAK